MNSVSEALPEPAPAQGGRARALLIRQLAAHRILSPPPHLPVSKASSAFDLGAGQRHSAVD